MNIFVCVVIGIIGLISIIILFYSFGAFQNLRKCETNIITKNNTVQGKIADSHNYYIKSNLTNDIYSILCKWDLEKLFGNTIHKITIHFSSITIEGTDKIIYFDKIGYKSFNDKYELFGFGLALLQKLGKSNVQHISSHSSSYIIIAEYYKCGNTYFCECIYNYDYWACEKTECNIEYRVTI